jgi:hypothetical protein
MDEISVVPHEHHDTRERWYYTAMQGTGADRLGYGCEVDVDTAYEYSGAKWWAEHGNAEMATYEARKWAEARVREMAASEFARHRRMAAIKALVYKDAEAL